DDVKEVLATYLKGDRAGRRARAARWDRARRPKSESRRRDESRRAIQRGTNIRGVLQGRLSNDSRTRPNCMTRSSEERIMTRSSLAYGLCFGLRVVARTASAQEPTFTLGIDAPAKVSGNPGSMASFDAQATLTTEGLEEGMPGAQGWQIAIACEGCSIVGVTTNGTAAEEEPGEGESGPGFRRGGFEKTELTAGDNNEGAVSAIVLSLQEAVTLPSTGSFPILALEV